MQLTKQTGPVQSMDEWVATSAPRLVASDGLALGATLFAPRGAALGSVIVHGATAAPAGYYRRFASFLARQGLRVLTYDYRGVGQSRPASLRGFRASMSDWGRLDAAAAHAFVRAHFPHEPLATVGHSFGGQLIGLLPEANEVQASVLVGSQLGYYGHWGSGTWGAFERLRLGLIWRALVPSLTASFGYLPGQAGLGEDLPRGVAEEWARWCLSPDSLIAHHPEARARFGRFDKPLLFYSFADDEIAPPRAVAALITQLSSASLEHRRIHPRDHDGQPIGHFGFFKPRFEQTLWRQTAQFLLHELSMPAAS